MNSTARDPEARRLAALRSLEILDSDPEREFDDLVAVVAALLDCPIALVSLVDKNRVWFKAGVGVPVREVSRDVRFCAKAIEKPNRTLVVPDARKDRRFRNDPLVVGPLGLRFYCGAPIVVEGVAIGTVCAIDSRPRVAEPVLIQALEAMARQAETLLRARRLTVDLRQSERRFHGAADASLDAFVVVRPVVDDGGVVDLEYRYANSLAGEQLSHRPDELVGRRMLELFPTSYMRSFAGHLIDVVRTGEPFEAEMISQMPGRRGRWMRVQAVSIGSEVAITSQDIHERKSQSNLIDQYASEMGSVNILLEAQRYELDQKRRQLEEANAKLEIVATTDGLTGLANRRTFDERLALEIDRAERLGRPLSVAMIDIDHFKALNDAHGHPAGDAALCGVARALAFCVRESDLVARYGGEEFVAIMPGSGVEPAMRVADRLRLAIADSRDHLPVTASIGVATFGRGMTEATLIEAADRALYASKRTGRNRTTHARDWEQAGSRPADAAVS